MRLQGAGWCRLVGVPLSPYVRLVAATAPCLWQKNKNKKASERNLVRLRPLGNYSQTVLGST